MEEAVGEVVFPGQRVADASPRMTLGSGVYERDGSVRASLAGRLRQVAAGPQLRLDVVPLCQGLTSQVIPAIGQDVIARVLRLASKYAAADILAVESQAGENETPNVQPLMEPIKGTIRLQDVVDVEEKETPPIQLAFRPGDLVRARVIGIGDPSAGLLLSTGLAAEYGVVFGRSAAAGAPLIPAAWNEMACSQTGVRERRKCAKPPLRK